MKRITISTIFLMVLGGICFFVAKEINSNNETKDDEDNETKSLESLNEFFSEDYDI